MASPTPGDAPNGVATPPNATQATLGGPSPPTTQTSGIEANTNGASTSAALPSEPATSLKIDELSHKRPRDARLIHLVLAAQGVQGYQERVPLMVMDFAYRYTSSILSDAFQFSNDGYYKTSTGRGADKEPTITLDHLRLSMAARSNYQFQPSLPKDYLLGLAAEKNKIALPKPERQFGLRLPPEKYMFTGVGWGLKEEWDEEEGVGGEEAEDEVMGGIEGGTADQEEVDQAEFEEVMGTGGSGGDTEMGNA
jgi:transcription initiation factor TFIID subunit 9B